MNSYAKAAVGIIVGLAAGSAAYMLSCRCCSSSMSKRIRKYLCRAEKLFGDMF